MQSKNKLKSFLFSLGAYRKLCKSLELFLSDWGVNGKHIGAPYMQAIFTLYFVMSKSLSLAYTLESWGREWIML